MGLCSHQSRFEHPRREWIWAYSDHESKRDRLDGPRRPEDQNQPTLESNAKSDCYVRNRSAMGLRSGLYHVSAAAVFAADDDLSLVADTAFDSNSDPVRSSWPGVLLVGAIYTLRPGLDVDVGYKTRLNRPAPAQQWLLGINYRWAALLGKVDDFSRIRYGHMCGEQAKSARSSCGEMTGAAAMKESRSTLPHEA